MALKFNIQCGMISVPVKLDAGARSERIALKQMTGTGHAVGQRLFDKTTGEEVHRSDVRKAFEAAPDVLVELPAAELDAIHPESSKVIALEEFVPEDSLDPIYFESSHYLSPEAAGTKSYALVYGALRRAKRVGIGTITKNGRTNPVALRASDRGLVLYDLFFKHEVRETREYRADESALNPKEVALADAFVDAMSVEHFDAGRFHDEYSVKLQALIDSKKAGVNVAPGPNAVAAPDIMAQLSASVAAALARKPAAVAVERVAAPSFAELAGVA